MTIKADYFNPLLADWLWLSFCSLAAVLLISCQNDLDSPEDARSKEPAVFQFPRDEGEWTEVQRALHESYLNHMDVELNKERPSRADAMRRALTETGYVSDEGSEILVFPDTGFISVQASGDELRKLGEVLDRVELVSEEGED